MRLTKKSDWRYQNHNVGGFDRLRAEQPWMEIVRGILPKSAASFIELGCAPGTVSACIAEERPWDCWGIDYSEDAETYVQTMSAVGIDARLVKADLFDVELDREFDIVGSFGLIEHFRDASLEAILSLHHSLARPGGLVVIEVPNFTGAQYFFHYAFDRPNLLLHNLDAMSTDVFNWFSDKGYTEQYCNFVGEFRVWGTSGMTPGTLSSKIASAILRSTNACSSVLARIGMPVCGAGFSPALLYIGQKPY